MPISIQITGATVEDAQNQMKQLLAGAYQNAEIKTSGEVAQPKQPETVAETPGTPETEADPAKPQVAVPPAKPDQYRGKNAETIAKALLDRVTAGTALSDLNASQQDDFNRLPKKWQAKVAEAVKSDDEPQVSMKPYVVLDTDGSTYAEAKTAAEWAEKLIERIDDTEDAADIMAVAKANREGALRMKEEGHADLSAKINAAADARLAGFAPVKQAEAPAKADTKPTPANPTREDVQAAVGRILATEGLGAAAAKALVKTFGIEALKDLPEARRAEFIAEIDSEIAGAGALKA